MILYSYTRNLVDDGGNYNLLVLCWNPQKGSPIHDHQESSCFLKVLDGKLQEIKYEVPKEGEQLKVTETAVHSRDTLTYMDSKETCILHASCSAQIYIVIKIFIMQLNIKILIH